MNTNKFTQYNRYNDKYYSVLPSDFRRASVLVVRNDNDNRFFDELHKRNTGYIMTADKIESVEKDKRYDYIYLNIDGLDLKKSLASIKNILYICNLNCYLIYDAHKKSYPYAVIDKLSSVLDWIRQYYFRFKILYYYRWIKKQLKYRYSIIKKISYMKPLFSNIYCIRIEMRKLEDLLVFSGPSGVGKTYFLDKMISDNRYCKVIGLSNLSSFKQLDCNKLKKADSLDMDKLLLHFNITRQLELEYNTYENEPAHIIGRSKNKTVYVFICPINTLIKRVKHRVRNKYFWSRRVKISNSIIDQYSKPGFIRDLYKNWINYCKNQGCKLFFIDVSSEDNIRVLSEKKAMEIID